MTAVEVDEQREGTTGATCPYCGEFAATVQEEVAHMEFRHPDVIAQRLLAAGLEPPEPRSASLMTSVVKASELLKAASHPLRIRILMQLEHAHGEAMTPRDVAKALDVQLENLSYHVRTLRDDKFIKLGRKKMVKGAIAHPYTLTDRGRALLAFVRRAMSVE